MDSRSTCSQSDAVFTEGFDLERLADLRLNISPEGDMTITTVAADGSEQSIVLPREEITRTVGEILQFSATAARERGLPPDGVQSIAPAFHNVITYPNKLSITRQETYPVIVLDYGGVLINAGMDMDSLRHVMDLAEKHYSQG